MTAAPAGGAPSLRSLAPSVFLPAMVYEIGNGAIAPVIALTALAVGASPAQAGFMLAVLGVGQVLGDLPAASLAERIGDRHAMLVAATVAIGGLVACFFARSLVVLGIGLLLIGTANATYYLGRQSYLAEVIPVGMRARAMSTLGGSHRLGLFLGPFIGAAVIGAFGLRAAYVVAMISASTAALALLVIPDVPVPEGLPPSVRGTIGSRRMFAGNRRLFFTMGIAIVAVSAVRAARQTVLPLWSQHLGMSAAQTSLVFGIASAVDVAMFYPSGQVMDRFGRLSIALPSMAILGGAMMLLPLTGGTVSLTIVAMVMSFGNGLGSGIMMTLGTDAAPLDGRVRFLSIWRLFSDSGNAAGPVVMSIVATIAGLASGIVAIGSVGLLAAVALGRWVPRYSPFARPRDAARLRAQRITNVPATPPEVAQAEP
jgi:MFS family permease